MINKISLFIGIFCLVFLSNCIDSKIEKKTPDYIIKKENGNVILAYKAFDDFLNSDRKWENYQNILLNAYPEVQIVHDRQMKWGIIDPVKFPEEIKDYKRSDFEKFLNQYTEEYLDTLYDSVINKAHTILVPVSNKPVDLCMFLPYGSCFIDVGEKKNTIFISLFINPDEVQKIMAHEYAHCLHHQRRPEEPLTLRRELVSEGLAVYLTTLIDEKYELKKAIPFMSEESVNWCSENEQLIKDTIQVELEDSGDQIFTKYISDGKLATPPQGFVQKTGYYIGYQIIEACIKKGMTLEEICSLDSKTIIDQSGYFNIK